MTRPDPMTQRVVAPVTEHRDPRQLLDPPLETEGEPVRDHDPCPTNPKRPCPRATDRPDKQVLPSTSTNLARYRPTTSMSRTAALNTASTPR